MSDWLGAITRRADRSHARVENVRDRGERSKDRLMSGIQGIGAALRDKRDFELEEEKFGLDEERFANDKEYRAQTLMNEARRLGMDEERADELARQWEAEFGIDHERGTDQDLAWAQLDLQRWMAEQNADRAAGGAGGAGADGAWAETVQKALEMSVGTQMEEANQDFYSVLKDPAKAQALRSNFERILNNEPGFEAGSQARADALALFDTMVRQAEEETPIDPITPDDPKRPRTIPEALAAALRGDNVADVSFDDTDPNTALRQPRANQPPDEGGEQTPAELLNAGFGAGYSADTPVNIGATPLPGAEETEEAPPVALSGVANDVQNVIDMVSGTYMLPTAKNNLDQAAATLNDLSNADLTENDIADIQSALDAVSERPTPAATAELKNLLDILSKKGKYSR